MQIRRLWLGALVTTLAVAGALAAGFAIDRQPRETLSAGAAWITADNSTDTDAR
jgi:hypothetical protein